MRIALFISIIGLGVFFSACEESSGKKSQPAEDKQLKEPEDPPEPTDPVLDDPPTPGNQQSEDVTAPVSEPSQGAATSSKHKLYTDLIDTCNNQFGRVWQPKQLTCGEPLAPYPCCADQVIARYPSLATQIEDYLGKKSHQNLFNCGVSEDGKTLNLYLFEVKGYKYTYSTYTINGGAKKVSGDNLVCPSDATVGDGNAKPYDGSIDGFEPTGADVGASEEEQDPFGDREGGQNTPSDGEDGDAIDPIGAPEPIDPSTGPDEGDPEPQDPAANAPSGSALWAEHCARCHPALLPLGQATAQEIIDATNDTAPMNGIATLKELITDQAKVDALVEYLKNR